MLSFFAKYISPGSPTRAKLSVHMLAQHKPVSAPTLSAAEQSDRLFQMLLQFLHANDVAVDPGLLERRLDGVDVGNAEVLISKLNEYLALDLGLEMEKCVDVAANAKVLLPTALAAAGVQGKTEEVQMNGVNGSFENGVEEVEKTKSVKIEDVHGWKAGLQVSAGPLPVKGLEEFEELEAKL
jgi:insulysin